MHSSSSRNDKNPEKIRQKRMNRSEDLKNQIESYPNHRQSRYLYIPTNLVFQLRFLNLAV